MVEGSNNLDKFTSMSKAEVNKWLETCEGSYSWRSNWTSSGGIKTDVTNYRIQTNTLGEFKVTITEISNARGEITSSTTEAIADNSPPVLEAPQKITEPAPSLSEEANQSSKKYNSKIIEYAKKQVGKRVDRGECWDLGAFALKFAGAEAPNNNKFGLEINETDLCPGDIAQWKTAKYVGENYWQTCGFPDHTAVVIDNTGTKIKVLHQNFGGKRFVHETTFIIGDFTEGSITYYRAI